MGHRDYEMFGMDIEDVKAMKPDRMGPGMWAMSMLSDMQEWMESGPIEVATDAKHHLRHGMNMVKYWIEESRHVESDDPRDR